MSLDDIVNLGLLDELAIIEQRNISQPNLLSGYEAAMLFAYSGNKYAPLNQFLRDNTTAPLPAFGDYLLGILIKLPAYKGMVYRSVNLTDAEFQKYEMAYKTKETISEPFFVSTSKRREVGERFGDTFFRIITRSGRAIADFSKHQAEEEVLIPCGAIFLIRKIDRQHDGRVVITMKEL